MIYVASLPWPWQERTARSRVVPEALMAPAGGSMSEPCPFPGNAGRQNLQPRGTQHSGRFFSRSAGGAISRR